MAQLWAWILEHQVVVVGAVVAMLDLVFALVPRLSGNGILHQLYVWLKKLIPKKDG